MRGFEKQIIEVTNFKNHQHFSPTASFLSGKTVLNRHHKKFFLFYPSPDCSLRSHFVDGFAWLHASPRLGGKTHIR